MRKKKLGLALGAGGSRGIAHIGFLQAMDEAGIVPDFISGCSMGSVVGGCYAAGIAPETMKARALALKLGKIAALNLSPFRMGGLMQLTRARELLEELLGGITFADLKIPFTCVATDLIKGETVTLGEGSLVDAMLASGSIPGVFTPARFGKYEMLADGSALERVPTKEVKVMGADVVVAVDVLGDILAREVSGNLIGTVLRYIDIMDSHNTERTRQSRDYIDLWLEPELGEMDQYKVKDLDFAYEKGYELGKENAENIRRLIGK